MVGPSGLEPPTSRLSGVRSNQLSYGPTGRASVGGSARRPGHSLPQPELPERYAPGRPEAGKEAIDARSRGGRGTRPGGGLGRQRGFSSKLQKERYEQRTDSKARKFDLEAAGAVVPKDLPTGGSP